MAVKVLIPTPLQKITNDQAEIQCDGATITELIETLAASCPDNMDTKLEDGAEVSIVPAVAGG